MVTQNAAIPAPQRDRAQIASESLRTRSGPWWRTIGFEIPAAAGGCAEDDCEPELVRATDVYCRRHQRFLPFATDRPSKTRWLVVNALRALVIGVFPMAALLHSSVPIFLLGAALGGLVLGAPLRLYNVNRKAAIVFWLVTSAIALLLWQTGTQVHRVTGTVLVVAATLAAGAYFADLAYRQGVEGLTDAVRKVPGKAAGVVAGAFVSGPLALLLLTILDVAPGSWVLRPPGSVRTWITGGAVAGVAVALFTAVLVGFLHGSRDVSVPADGWLKVGDKPTPPPVPLPERKVHQRPTNFFDRIGIVLDRALYGLALAGARSAQVFLTMVWTGFYLLEVALIRTVNFLYRMLLILLSGLWQTVLGTLRILRGSAQVAGSASVVTAKVLVVPLVSLATAAILVVLASGSETGYLLAGGLATFSIMTASVLGAVALLTLVWVLFSGDSFWEALDSARHNLEATVPNALGLVTAGCWVTGLPGSLGYGPIRIGPVTIILTVFFVGSYAWYQWRNRSHRAASQDES